MSAGPMEKIEAQTFDGMVTVRASRLIYLLGFVDGLMTQQGDGVSLGLDATVDRLLQTPVTRETESTR